MPAGSTRPVLRTQTGGMFMANLQSMTGFARIEGKGDTAAWAWEVKSVNGRNLDLRVTRTHVIQRGFDARVIDPTNQPLPRKYRDLTSGKRVRSPAVRRAVAVPRPRRPASSTRRRGSRRASCARCCARCGATWSGPRAGYPRKGRRSTPCSTTHCTPGRRGTRGCRGRAPHRLRFELGVRPGAPSLLRYRSGDVAA